MFGSINVREYRRGNQQWTIHRNWQHIGYTRRRKTKENTTQYVLNTTIRKQTEMTPIRHEPSYNQLEVKTIRISFLCGNRNGHHTTELRT